MVHEKEKEYSKDRERPKKRFAVIMYNDDYTTMDFVVVLLVNVFNYTVSSAVDLMLQIHNSDKRVIAIYPEKLAYAKKDKALRIAKENNFDKFRVEVEEV